MKEENVVVSAGFVVSVCFWCDVEAETEDEALLAAEEMYNVSPGVLVESKVIGSFEKFKNTKACFVNRRLDKKVGE